MTLKSFLQILKIAITGIIGFCFGLVGFWGICLLLGSIFPHFFIPTLAFVLQFFFLMALSIISGVICAKIFISVNKLYVTVPGLIIVLILMGNFNHDIKNMPQDNHTASQYEKKAIAKLDSTICEKITDPFFHQNCYFGIAIRTGDRNLCNKLTEPKRVYNCLAIIDKDIEKCRSISEDNYLIRDECLEGIAVVTKNPIICDEIETGGYRSHCYEDLGIESKRY